MHVHPPWRLPRDLGSHFDNLTCKGDHPSSQKSEATCPKPMTGEAIFSIATSLPIVYVPLRCFAPAYFASGFMFMISFSTLRRGKNHVGAWIIGGSVCRRMDSDSLNATL